MGCFNGIDVTDDFIDNKEFYGNAFHILSEASQFIMRHLPISSSFENNSFERIDRPILPVLAVREALVNAICHRDYSARSGYISVAIFNDRLEIWSKGTLSSELALDDLKKKHKSVPRNKSIAKVFYDRRFFEGWGGGTVKMVNLCREATLPEPIFEEYSGGFSVTFNFPTRTQTLIAPTLTESSHITIRQKEILSILNTNGHLSLREIVSLLENPPATRTIGDDLATLKSEGLAQSTGIGRGAKWFILRK